MKVLRKAPVPAWACEQTCTCRALLLVEEGDIFKVRNDPGRPHWKYHCPECDKDTNFKGTIPSEVAQRIRFNTDLSYVPDDGGNQQGYGRGDG